MNFVELLVSLQWNKNHNTVKILLFKLEALYIYIYTHTMAKFFKEVNVCPAPGGYF